MSSGRRCFLKCRLIRGYECSIIGGKFKSKLSWLSKCHTKLYSWYLWEFCSQAFNVSRKRNLWNLVIYLLQFTNSFCLQNSSNWSQHIVSSFCSHANSHLKIWTRKIQFKIFCLSRQFDRFSADEKFHQDQAFLQKKKFQKCLITRHYWYLTQ